MLPATRGSNHRDPQDDTVTSSGNHRDLQEHTATGFVADLVLADGALIQPIGNTRRIWISDSCTAWKNVKRQLSWTNPYDTGPALCRRFIRILIVISWSEKTLEAEAPLSWFVSLKALSSPSCWRCFRVAVSIYVHDVLRQLFDWGVWDEGRAYWKKRSFQMNINR